MNALSPSGKGTGYLSKAKGLIGLRRSWNSFEEEGGRSLVKSYRVARSASPPCSGGGS